MWILIIWFLTGIISAITLLFVEKIIPKEDIILSEVGMFIAWCLIGPVLWLSFMMILLTSWIESHKSDSVIKFKNNKFK